MNIHTYSLALISTSGSQKSPTAISHEIGISQSSISRFLNNGEDCNQELIQAA